MSELTTYEGAELVTRDGSPVAEGTALLSTNNVEVFFWPHKGHLAELFDARALLALVCSEQRLFVRLGNGCEPDYMDCPKRLFHYHLQIEQRDPDRN